MLKITGLFLDGGRIKEGIRSCITDTETPTFSWKADTDSRNAFQKSYHIKVMYDGELMWDSGKVISPVQSAKYAGKRLPKGVVLTVILTITSNNGEESGEYIGSFVVGALRENEIIGKWIGAAEENDGRAIYFRREFSVSKEVKSACLYVAGIGYHKITVNGIDADDSHMDPAHSNYKKTVYYTVHADMADKLNSGSNVIGITVADGWRHNTTEFCDSMFSAWGREIEFFGRPLLWAMLQIDYADGTGELVVTDESWGYRFGPIVYASIFNGETFDARENDGSWNKLDTSASFTPATVYDCPTEEMRPMVLEPITEACEYYPLEITQPETGKFIIDFGQNIAGVIRLVLPDGLSSGQTITMRHTEELDDSGLLFADGLRSAKATDTYIAAGDSRDLIVWQPEFTYHGFRYAEITGLDHLAKEDVTAILICTDLKNDSFFRCGSGLVNEIQDNIIMTEMDNMHSILTDCPQRDERMAWMNDATVRFEETPYNFDIGRMFPKIIRDIRNEQRPEGQFTCCSPFVFGALPADAVCSSYLVAGYETLMHIGNTEIIEESFDGFAKWEDFLIANSTDYVVNYSHYGDWAAPGYACYGGDEGACNIETEGIFMSTGYSYLNCKLLSEMAEMIGRDEDAKKYSELAERVKEGIFKKWWNNDTATFDTFGKPSEGAQAFALWLGIVPEDREAEAAKVMRDDLVNRGYKFTTGNLCTRYMADMLAKHGYIDEAWAMLTNEEYPSFGYMIQNEATTVWERFENKKNGGMNSHNHPMYGAMGSFFYQYIVGIKPIAPAYERVRIKPYMPEKLLSAHAVVDSVKGDISVRWAKRYGKKRLFVQIPFGVSAEVDFGGKVVTVGSGYHVFEEDWNTEV